MTGEDDLTGETETTKKPRAPRAKPAAKTGLAHGAGLERRGPRVPFGGNRTKLDVEFVEGFRDHYHPHWVNEGNIHRALQGYYEFATLEDVAVAGTAETTGADLGGKIRQLVGTGDTGGPQYAYLMKVRKEYFEQDQADLATETANLYSMITKGTLAPVDRATEPKITATRNTRLNPARQ